MCASDGCNARSIVLEGNVGQWVVLPSSVCNSSIAPFETFRVAAIIAGYKVGRRPGYLNAYEQVHPGDPRYDAMQSSFNVSETFYALNFIFFLRFLLKR